MFGTISLETMMGGSHTSFKPLPKPKWNEGEKEQYLDNKRQFQRGIHALRVLRTAALKSTDAVLVQNYLERAYQLSCYMADLVLTKALERRPAAMDNSLLDKIADLSKGCENIEPDFGYLRPPQYSVQNLFEAAEDMYARIHEKSGHYLPSSQKLNEDELRYIFREFLIGVNHIANAAQKELFMPNTRVVGILSGGSVYTEMVKLITERYGESNLKISTSCMAVDKEGKSTACKKDVDDDHIKTVLLLDDCIHKGGTISTALWQTGQYYPNATIFCEGGCDYPGEFQKRKNHQFEVHLEIRFQDYADFANDGQKQKARAVLAEAQQYASEHKVELQPGWMLVKKRCKL